MGKKKTTTAATGEPGVNKSQAIKAALAATPDKPPKQIAEELQAQGLDVNAAYVSTIKTNLKAAGGASKKTGKKVVQEKRVAAPTAASDLTFNQLRQAKELSQQLGGVEKAKEALAALSELTS